ncbi:FCD domain-containing protein [Aurantimonas aggregata]|uniref:FCD domain-containing protein n=1 Tax=Aurantimonas aggregata TaxID=2047720 RepID=A0A6L9MN98_9HYPH|nr:GntR family transcriptional regulator [Aurantimonas aggregata]NDV89182.1 FCD domain-containing protein [Aurantimonas aggregata]
MTRLKSPPDSFDLSTSLLGLSIDRDRSIGPQLYSHLRQRIINGQLPPGAPIHENEVAELCHISRTPLRAALQRLASDGLIVTKPQVGSIVAPRDEARIWEALFIRSAIEQQVAGRLAGNSFDEEAIQPILARQEAAAAIDDYVSFFTADEEFHALLASTAGVPRAWQLVQSVKAHVDRERFSLTSSIPGRSRRAFEEHLILLRAIRSGNAEAAKTAMRQHLDSVLDTSRMEQHPVGTARVEAPSRAGRSRRAEKSLSGY